MYVVVGKGADIAAWKQAARAELTDLMDWKTGYAQALLDLVKAFDRVPHWLLLREAHALGYPIWMLKLSIATYRLPRVIRVGKSYSVLILALHSSITAGSGLATTEMKLCMLRNIIRALELHPSIIPTSFVDDIAAECTGPDEVVAKELGGFIKEVAVQIKADGMELSKTKSVFTANSEALGKLLTAVWKEAGVAITFQKYVKSLGVQLARGMSESKSSG